MLVQLQLNQVSIKIFQKFLWNGLITLKDNNILGVQVAP